MRPSRHRRLAVGFAIGVAAVSACTVRGPIASTDALAVALPPGEGAEILRRECLKCHELGALELFSGFYGREQWRALVVTMRENGAEVDEDQVTVLADYLATHFGTGGAD